MTTQKRVQPDIDGFLQDTYAHMHAIDDENGLNDYYRLAYSKAGELSCKYPGLIAVAKLEQLFVARQTEIRVLNKDYSNYT